MQAPPGDSLQLQSTLIVRINGQRLAIPEQHVKRLAKPRVLGEQAEADQQMSLPPPMACLRWKMAWDEAPDHEGVMRGYSAEPDCSPLRADLDHLAGIEQVEPLTLST